MSKFSFTTLLEILKLYVRIKARWDELTADGSASVDDIFNLLAEFGLEIEALVEKLS